MLILMLALIWFMIVLIMLMRNVVSYIGVYVDAHDALDVDQIRDIDVCVDVDVHFIVDGKYHIRVVVEVVDVDVNLIFILK